MKMSDMSKKYKPGKASKPTFKNLTGASEGSAGDYENDTAGGSMAGMGTKKTSHVPKGKSGVIYS